MTEFDKWDVADFFSTPRALFAVLMGALLSVPLVLGTYYTRIAASILILGYFGVVFNWAFGHANLPAFGHAAFYGLGAYGFTMATHHFEGGLLVPLLVGISVPFVYSIIVGVFSVRGKGIYFALLTFAFAQFTYEIVFRLTDITGGSDGMIVFAPDLAGISLTNPDNVYYISLLLLGLTLLFGYRMLESPYGRVLYAIHYNEERAKTIGYPVNRIKISIFVLTATLSSIAGILFALSNQFISPSVLNMQMSVDVLIISIIGGTSTLVGPLIGAAMLVTLEELVSDLHTLGTVVTGIVFILTILFIPEGIAGMVRERFRSE